MGEWIKICSSRAQHQQSPGVIAHVAALGFLPLSIHTDTFTGNSQDLPWPHSSFSLAAAYSSMVWAAHNLQSLFPVAKELLPLLFWRHREVEAEFK